MSRLENLAERPSSGGRPNVRSLTIDGLRGEIGALLARSSDTAGLDARLLVAHAAGLDPARVALLGDALAPPPVRRMALAHAARRLNGEPVARIVGEKEFWGLTLRLSPDTLVPRPDTETVVAAALAAVEAEGRRGDALRILDLGTGSGAILLALLSELPEAFGIGCDINEGAARTARDNASRLSLEDRSAFHVGDYAAALGGRFDLVVANPPYIAAGEIDALPVEVRDFDPYISLAGGADGLAAYRLILADLDRLLAPAGKAFLEVGAGQTDKVAGMASTAGFLTDRHRDLGGIERVVEIVRGAPEPG